MFDSDEIDFQGTSRSFEPIGELEDGPYATIAEKTPRVGVSSKKPFISACIEVQESAFQAGLAWSMLPYKVMTGFR